MPALLKIDVSPRGDYFVSRHLSQQFVAEWQKTHTGTVTTRDLTKTDLPFVDLPWITGADSTPDQHTPEQKAALKVSNDLFEKSFGLWKGRDTRGLACGTASGIGEGPLRHQHRYRRYRCYRPYRSTQRLCHTPVQTLRTADAHHPPLNAAATPPPTSL